MNILTSAFIRHGYVFEKDTSKMLAFFTGYLLSTILTENQSSGFHQCKIDENRLRLTDTKLELIQVCVDSNDTVKALTLTHVCFPGLICADPKHLQFSPHSTSFVNVTLNLWSVKFSGISKGVQYQTASTEDVQEFLQNDHVKLPLTWSSDRSFDSMAKMVREFIDVYNQISNTGSRDFLKPNMKFFLLGCTMAVFDGSTVQVALYHDEPNKNNEAIFAVDRQLIAITFSAQYPCAPPDFSFNLKSAGRIQIEQQKSNSEIIVTDRDRFQVCQKSHVQEILDSLNHSKTAHDGELDGLHRILASLLILSKNHNLSIPWYLIGQMTGLRNNSALFAWSFYCLDHSIQSNDDLTIGFSQTGPDHEFQTMVIMALAQDNQQELCESMSLAAELQLKSNVGRQTVHFANLLKEDVSNLGGKKSANIQLSVLPLTMLTPDFRERISKFSLNDLVKHQDFSNYVQPCLKCLLHDPVFFLDRFSNCLPRKPGKIGNFLSALVGHIKLSTSSLNIHNAGLGIHVIDNEDLAYKHMVLLFHDSTEECLEYHELYDFDNYLSKSFIKNGRILNENIAVNFIQYELKNQEFSFRAKSLKINDKNRLKIGQCILWIKYNIISPRPSCNFELQYPDTLDPSDVIPVEEAVDRQKHDFTFVNLTKIFSSQKILFDGYRQKTQKVALKIRKITDYFTNQVPKNVELILSDQTTMLDDCVYFDFLTYSTNISTSVWHDVISRAIDLCATLHEICNKMHERPDHLMIWLRSNSRETLLASTNKTDESSPVKFFVSKMKPDYETGTAGIFTEFNNIMFHSSYNLIAQSRVKNLQRPSDHDGSVFVLTRKTTNVRLCIHNNLNIFNHPEYGFIKSANICVINGLSCETSSDILGSLTQVEVSGHFENTSIVSFETNYEAKLFYEIDHNQCHDTVIQLPYCTRNVRISDKGRFTFVSLISNSSVTRICGHIENIMFTFDLITSASIIVDETIDQVRGTKTTVTNQLLSSHLYNKTQICFTTRCVTIFRTILYDKSSAQLKNQWTIWFRHGFSLRFSDDTSSILLTYFPDYYQNSIDSPFHHRIIRLSHRLNNRSLFVSVRQTTFSSINTHDVFYLNMNQKIAASYKNREYVPTVGFIQNDPECELVVHSINLDTVVSIRANRLIYDHDGFWFKTVNIEFSERATTTVDLTNRVNHKVEDDRIEINFEQTGRSEFTIFISEKDANLIGIVIFFDVNNTQLISSRINVFLKNQFLRFLPKNNNQFFVANIPVNVPLMTEIFVLSEEYARFPCELETNFLLGGLSFLRVEDHLIMKNIDSNRTLNAENRFTLILLDFFDFPSSSQNITVHFRKQSVVLLN